jgi:hypothetical protein
MTNPLDTARAAVECTNVALRKLRDAKVAPEAFHEGLTRHLRAAWTDLERAHPGINCVRPV